MDINLTPEELSALRHAIKVEIASFKAEQMDDPDLVALISLVRKLDTPGLALGPSVIK
jgi:DNA-binding FadR family transcriptional regulator